MRVLLWYWGRRGGGARITLELARALAATEGVEPLLATARGNELAAELRGLGLAMRVDRVHPPGLGAAWLPGPQSLGSWVKRQRIDVVVQVMGHPLSWPAARTLEGSGAAFVDMVHDANPHLGDHKYAYDMSVARARGRADHLVALSEHVRDTLVVSGVVGERITVIPHGPLFEGSERMSRTDGEPVVLFFGRIRTYKGIDLLLAAWPDVLRQAPDAILRIAGEGDLGPYRNTLNRLLRVELANRWCPDAAVPGVVGAASVVVLPYREASQSGVVTIAQSLHVPVVATRVGGLREQVRDGLDGVLVEPTADAIGAAIVRMLREPIPARGSGLSPATITWREVATRLAAVCTEVCAASNATRRRLGRDL